MPDIATSESARGRETGETAARTVAAQLRADIIGGRLEPAGKLVLDDLRRHYGVGTSPLREALSWLAAEGLVRLESQRGFWVASVSVDEAVDIYALRVQLETHALELAMRHGDDQWEGAALAAHHRLARIDDVRDSDRGFPSAEWERRHRVFHFALLAAAGSPWTLHFLDQLYDQADRYRRVAGLASDEQRPQRATHRQLVELVVDRDRDAALDCLETHLREAGDLVLDALRRLGVGGVSVRA